MELLRVLGVFLSIVVEELGSMAERQVLQEEILSDIDDITCSCVFGNCEVVKLL